MKFTKDDFYSLSAKKDRRKSPLGKVAQTVAGLKFFLGCFAVIRDPSKTDSVLRSAQGLITEERFAPTLKFLKTIPGADEIFLRKPLLPILDLEVLKTYPKNTLGFAFSQHMERNGFDPDFYDVEFSDDVTYVFYRYGKIHDLLHVLTGFDTSIEGEIGLLSYSYAQNRGAGLILAALLGLFHGVFYKPHELYKYVSSFAAGWQMGRTGTPFFTLDWEQALTKDLNQVRQDLKLPQIPIVGSESIAPEPRPTPA